MATKKKSGRTIIRELREALAQTEADLESAHADMRSDAARIVQLREDVRQLQTKLNNEALKANAAQEQNKRMTDQYNEAAYQIMRVNELIDLLAGDGTVGNWSKEPVVRLAAYFAKRGA
jgi:capsule polysaccharide export protein KpsE/RkpR